MWWYVPAAFATPDGCAVPVARAALIEALGRAEIAAVALDAPGLASALDAANEDLACLDEASTPSDAAALFRLSGVRAFVDGDEADAIEWFRSARTLQPSYRLDPALGGPLGDLWDGTVPSTAAPASTWPPASGWFVIDGQRASAFPSDRRYVFQWFADDGSVRANRIAGPADPPVYTLAPQQQVADPVPRLHQGRTSRTLLAAGFGAAIVGGIGLGTAAAIKAQVLGSELPAAEQQAKVNANLALGYSGYGLVGVAAGLGASAVLVGRW